MFSKESSGAAGQQGGGHRWEGTALALRAGGGYGTVGSFITENIGFIFWTFKKFKFSEKKENKSFSSSYADY